MRWFNISIIRGAFDRESDFVKRPGDETALTGKSRMGTQEGFVHDDARFRLNEGCLINIPG